MKTKPIKNYEGIYDVTDDGRVLSLERKVVYLVKGKTAFYTKEGDEKKLISDRFGCLWVILYGHGKPKRFRVDRLVAEAFVPNPENKPEITHINKIMSDNNASNLQWITKEEWKNSLREKQFDTKLTKDQVLEIRRLYAYTKITQQELADQFHASVTNIRNILQRITWKDI